jgi:hypothetical protein
VLTGKPQAFALKLTSKACKTSNGEVIAID